MSNPQATVKMATMSVRAELSLFWPLELCATVLEMWRGHLVFLLLFQLWFGDRNTEKHTASLFI